MATSAPIEHGHSRSPSSFIRIGSTAPRCPRTPIWVPELEVRASYFQGRARPEALLMGGKLANSLRHRLLNGFVFRDRATAAEVSLQHFN